MTVTAPKGFTAAGVASGIKGSGALDLAVVVNEGPHAEAAGVFTQNRCRANPVIWSEKVLSQGQLRAVVLNSGGANCYTGDEGRETVRQTAQAAAEALESEAERIAVCSTGIIGRQLPRGTVVEGVRMALRQRTASSGPEAARAIMTTDTRPKTATFTAADGWTIGAMAKGSGMIAPGLATMLVVITTDAVATQPTLDAALRRAAEVTFNRLDIDGCQSTNDSVIVMSSGASEVEPSEEDLVVGLTAVCQRLTRDLQGDGEGMTHTIDVTVRGAASEADALEAARAIARNNLVKTAIAGNDPNWGRVLAAIGTTRAAFDPYNVDVFVNGTRVAHQGGPDADPALVHFDVKAVTIVVDLFSGAEEATLWTTDLTHEYVTINSEYES
ncbi:MAG: bifunctional glutamate N-acetyltransferase/amino-acid acetyltransferase ArgJ [Microbacteriaceae bacterium]|nr:bifunctional glutamate N-acetyltransferase/amino-acid acetyltransferase ArgJ [Microbacteriaceae bacterium]MCI1207074.1 bifunctional glutamate N-acetyltransferase/amino-acid acetyltransferase ArgJ [Microbacteriaceae bacterium]